MIEPKSETAKYRELTARYCTGCGVDIASHGDPVVPWAINFELPAPEYATYNDNNRPLGPIQISGNARVLPFNSDSLDFVYSSHLLEDFEDWAPLVQEWYRTLKPGGYMVILIPDETLWKAAIAAGQPDNPAHKHLGKVGELSEVGKSIGLVPVVDRLTDLYPNDYSILFVGMKP